MNAKHYYQILIFITFLYCQPKEEIEFELNSISGYVLESVNASPLIDIMIEVLSGNNMVKDSTFSDENGFYLMENVGYVWKPKIRFSHRDFHTHSEKLLLKYLDSMNNVLHDAILNPIPEENKIKPIVKSSRESRAESFFTEGNIFYTIQPFKNTYKAEHIIIKSIRVIENQDNYLTIKVNDIFYDPVVCYVPQMNKYENLTSIMEGYFEKPYFKKSKFPQFLPDSLLRNTMIYGSVIDSKTMTPIFGAEVRIPKTSKRRITSNDGKFAFEVNQPGRYEIIVEAPIGSGLFQRGKTEILVKNSKGGWFKSNQYLVER